MSELPRCKRCNGPILPQKRKSGPPKVYCTKKCQEEGTYLQRKAQGKIKRREGVRSMPAQFTRRFAFGQDIELLRMITTDDGKVVGISTDRSGERVICYSGNEIDMARAYMSKDKEPTVYMLRDLGWVVVELERGPADGEVE